MKRKNIILTSLSSIILCSCGSFNPIDKLSNYLDKIKKYSMDFVVTNEESNEHIDITIKQDGNITYLFIPQTNTEIYMEVTEEEIYQYVKLQSNWFKSKIDDTNVNLTDEVNIIPLLDSSYFFKDDASDNKYYLKDSYGYNEYVNFYLEFGQNNTVTFDYYYEVSNVYLHFNCLLHNLGSVELLLPYVE